MNWLYGIITSAAAGLFLHHIIQGIRFYRQRRELISAFVEIQFQVFDNFTMRILFRQWNLVTIILNGGLFRAVGEMMHKAKKEDDDRETALAATIAGIMVRSKAIANAKSYITLMASLFVYIVVCLLTDTVLSPLPIVCFTLLMLAIYINQTILEYRIRKSFYGFNPYEAKEVIQFILLHSDKSDFSDADGLKSVFPEAEMDDVYERLHDLLPGHVS